MLKASRALLKVATIIGTICGALILAFVPACFVLGFSNTIRDMLVKAINDGEVTIHSSVDLKPEQIALMIQVMFIVLGFTLLPIGVLCVINAMISSKTRNEPTRGRYIACIVTGALSTDFSIIAGIFGLICLNRESRQNKIEE